MAKCEVCGKIGQWGHNVSHSKRRTKTRWLPNIQKRKAANGRYIKICTRCLRTLHKVNR